VREKQECPGCCYGAGGQHRNAWKVMLWRKSDMIVVAVGAC